jgi:hypothetical protein
MTRLLLFIKHRLPLIWRGIEWLNAVLFRLLHADRLQRASEQSLGEFTLDGYRFRPLRQEDLGELFDLLQRQRPGRLAYFKPHGFDRKSLQRACRNPAFLMFGVFDGGLLVGYFFLRCFWNRTCFIGRLIDEPHENKGIGRVMTKILQNTAWRAGFRCLMTISKSNTRVMRSYANDPTLRILEELPKGYLLVEFVQPRAGQ